MQERKEKQADTDPVHRVVKSQDSHFQRGLHDEPEKHKVIFNMLEC